MAIGRIGDAGHQAMLFGLPGNPVAVMVSFYAFVRDALLRMAGASPQPLPLLRAASVAPIRKKRADLVADLGDVRRQVDIGVAALEPILDLRPRKVMQHDLHHRELVEVGIEQRRNDHAGAAGWRADSCRAVG